jgi:ABC-type spermidine/putrescine transport system permease subunit I
VASALATVLLAILLVPILIYQNVQARALDRKL